MTTPISQLSPSGAGAATQHKLAKLLAGKTEGTPVTPAGPVRLTRGVVQSVPGDGTLVVTLYGDDASGTLITADVINSSSGSYAPLTVVEVLIAPPRVVVLGVLGNLGWQIPTLLNSWANIGGFTTAGYRLIGNQVRLQGGVFGGTSGSVVFNMPVGYRPPALQVISGVVAQGFGGATGTGGATITTAGDVAWNTSNAGSSPVACVLDGITFLLD